MPEQRKNFRRHFKTDLYSLNNINIECLFHKNIWEKEKKIFTVQLYINGNLFQ